MEYYEQCRNAAGCVCRPWPIMTATQADDEIARLRAEIDRLRLQLSVATASFEYLAEMYWKDLKELGEKRNYEE